MSTGLLSSFRSGNDIERAVTGARGAAADIVRDLKMKVEDARVTLLAALAKDRMARRDPGKAIPLLEQALERRPDREDLAVTLRVAYFETGQVSRARALLTVGAPTRCWGYLVPGASHLQLLSSRPR